MVLAGGQSSRMGMSKAALEWHGSTLLRRTVGILARVVDGPVVVVRAPGQHLPDLPEGTLVTDDPREGKGPVQGIAAGLTALRGQAGTAFVASTDMPFLHPVFVRRILRALEDARDADVAIPFARGYKQPLAAAYRVRLAATAQRLVTRDRLRPAFLFAECSVRQLEEDTLRRDPLLAALDPDLESVVNVNTPGDYQAARARLAPEVSVRIAQPHPEGGDGGRPDAPGRTARAATVGAAARAVDFIFCQHTTAMLNGGRLTRDGETPLATGDTVTFRRDQPGR